MNRQRTRHKSSHAESKGFTLLEILVALSILLVGLTSVLVLFPQSLSQASTANQKTNASNQASEIFGEIGQIGADALYYDRVPYDKLRRSSDDGSYGFTTTTQRIGDGSTDSKLQRVTLTVTFPNGTSQTYATYVVKP